MDTVRFAEKLKDEIIADTAYGCDCNQHSGYYDFTIKIGDIPEYVDNLVKKNDGGSEMKVKEMVEILSQFPDNEEVTLIYPEDCYGEETGVIIDEVTYIKSSSKDRAKNGVFIRIG